MITNVGRKYIHGDNVVDPSPHTPWYSGPTLLRHLEGVHIASDWNLQGFRFPVQWVNRPDAEFRGYCGTIVSGRIAPGAVGWAKVGVAAKPMATKSPRPSTDRYRIPVMSTLRIGVD